MATFTAGTSFTDGVTGDVTAAKLNALVANATPLSNFITDRTAETSIATDDLVLISDTSDSGALNKMTVANLMKAEITGTINSTAGTITTGVIPTLTSTTLITSGTGTAAAPAIVPTGDTNTGIFFPAADTIAFSEGGAESMRIDSSGRTIIGATSASIGNPLEVVCNSSGMSIGVRGRPSDNVGIISFHPNASNTEYARIQSDSTSSLYFGTGSAGTERLRIDSSGNVLIGTTSASVGATGRGLLEINGSTDSLIALKRGGTAGLYLYTSSAEGRLSQTENLPLTLYTNNTERLRIDSNGRVGIGTTSPSLTLDINAPSPSLGITATTGTERVFARATNTGGNFYFGIDSSTGGLFGGAAYARTLHSDGAYPIAIYTNATERLRIDSSGNVGIGTTSPTTNHRLTISDADARMDVTSTNATYASLRIISNNTAYASIDTGLASDSYTTTKNLVFQANGGFVSIGTATGLSALHVHGNVTLSNTTTATSAGTGGLSKPATYAGYLTVSINGTSRKIPYYAT